MLRGDTKAEATLRASALLRRTEPVRLGLVSGSDLSASQESSRPIEDVIAEFRAYLEGEQVSAKYVKTLTGYALATARGAKARCLADLRTDRIETFLAGLVKSGRSYATRNAYRRALAALILWAQRRGKTTHNPVGIISRLNAAEDPRQTSRALTFAELEALIQSAPEPRRTYYIVAAMTGLRWGEIARLQWSDLDLDAGVLALRAKATKARRADVLPLARDVVAALIEHRNRGMRLDGRVFEARPAIHTWRRDLAGAGIITGALPGSGNVPLAGVQGYATPAGRPDRKSLRKTFVSHLAARGVPLQAAQRLARHKDPKLTANIYTDPAVLELREAVERLDKPQGKPREARKTS